MFHVEPSAAVSGPDAFAERFNVSRETLRRLEAFDRTLIETQAHTNLIARSTVEDRWDRHFADSAQLFAAIPDGAQRLIDLGSGAGFPGLILAALGRARGLRVVLVESTGKKATFLERAVRAMGLENVDIERCRIESLRTAKADVITARALAPLSKLLGYAYPLCAPDTLCIFPKGQDVDIELTEATKSWHIEIERRPSETQRAATILLVRRIRPKRPAARN